jgi:ATP-dependent DNA helicase PIF1
VAAQAGTDGGASIINSEFVVQSVLLSTIGSRDYSAQESAHHLLGLPLFFCSRTFVVLNTGGFRAVDETGMVSNLLDHYAKRSEKLAEICAFEFVQCFNNKGTRRRKEVVVHLKPRLRRILKDGSHNDKWYEQRMMVFLPWRDNSSSLKGSFPSWREAYLARESEINENCRKCRMEFSILANELPQEENVLVAAEDSKSEGAAAAVVAPAVDVNIDLDATDRPNLDPYRLANYETRLPADLQQEPWMVGAKPDIDSTGKKAVEDRQKTGDILPKVLVSQFENFLRCMPANYDWSSLGQEWAHIPDIDKWLSRQRESDVQLSFDCVAVQPDTLNEEQRCVFDSILKHAESDNEKRPPFRAIVLGKAGTGKSHLLFALRTALKEKCVLLAPTGVAALNIQGHTIHSKLSIPVSQKTVKMDNLTTDALHILQEAWREIEYIFIDEVSMVGQCLLGKIDRRLREIFSTHNNEVFGGRSVIFFGDFGQLPPVADSSLFSAQKIDQVAASRREYVSQGRLAYSSVKQAFFLNTVVRQDGDVAFRDLLFRLHDGIITKEDWLLLCERGQVANQTLRGAPFEKAICLFPKQDDVFRHNFGKLKDLQKNEARIVTVFHAVHSQGGKTAANASSDDAGGLEAIIALCVGARVMLTRNLWVTCGLVNGSIGTVQGIVFEDGHKPPNLPQAVLVNFPSFKGVPLQPNNVVPITPLTSSWTHNKKFCQRTQVPLRLCWATTIHKSQGLTLDNVVVNLGLKDFSCGLTYVALSRVRSLNDLCLHPVDYSRFVTISKSPGMANRQKEEKRLEKMNKKSKK